MRVPTSSYVVCWVFQLLKDALLVFMSLTEVTGVSGKPWGGQKPQTTPLSGSTLEILRNSTEILTETILI